MPVAHCRQPLAGRAPSSMRLIEPARHSNLFRTSLWGAPSLGLGALFALLQAGRLVSGADHSWRPTRRLINHPLVYTGVKLSSGRCEKKSHHLVSLCSLLSSLQLDGHLELVGGSKRELKQAPSSWLPRRRSNPDELLARSSWSHRRGQPGRCHTARQWSGRPRVAPGPAWPPASRSHPSA